MKRVPIALFLVLALTAAAHADSDIKADEKVVFYPTYAYLDKAGEKWVIPVHGWIFEPEKDAVMRNALLALLGKRLGLRPGQADTEIFKARARLFLVDNERGKQLTIQLGRNAFTLNDSLSNGHFRTSVYFPAAEVRDLAVGQKPKEDWLRFRVVVRGDDKRAIFGRVQFVAPKGISAICDIDDTIKVSNVRDRKALLANTFVREFEAVPGMASLLQRWAKAGVRFEYLTASPWQLYEPLRDFMDTAGFPRGAFRMKTFRWKDKTFFSLFQHPEEFKEREIRMILRRFPERKFILIGDSGESDPEIYGQTARRYPEQVVGILIRNVTGEEADGERFTRAFRGVPRKKWGVFDLPEELRGKLPNLSGR